jgi:hypothetical protein
MPLKPRSCKNVTSHLGPYRFYTSKIGPLKRKSKGNTPPDCPVFAPSGVMMAKEKSPGGDITEALRKDQGSCPNEV